MRKLKILLAILIAPIIVNAQAKTPIEINLPDKVINGTKLRMKAHLFAMTYNQGLQSLTLNWRVSYYSDSGGTYGHKIELPGISTYTKESVANNTVFVNPLTGAFVEKDLEGQYPAGSVGQYDFFYNLAENHDVNVHDLIRSYGAAVKEW